MGATCLVLTAAVQAGCRGSGDNETATVVTVDVAPVLRASIRRTIRSEALLYPLQQAALVPKIPAPIRRVHVTRGARVRPGDLLVELESGDLAGAAAESRAAYDLAQASFETTARATVPEERQKAELEVKATKDVLDAQQAIFDSRQALLKEGAIAQKDVNDAQATLSQARTQYETARKRLDDLQGFAHEQALKAAAAQRDVAKAHDEAMQAQFSYSRIASPLAGVVTDLPFYAGETAPAGAPVVTVMDVSRVIARAHVSQAEATELAVGNSANLLGPGGAPIPGTVIQISPAVDAAGTTVEVWVQAHNADGALRPGTNLRVEMIARTVADALVIPRTAVLTSASGTTFTIVIDADNTAHVKKIATGISDSGAVEVTDGLESGQRVATTGAVDLFKLDPDVLSKVKVQIAPAKEEEEEEEPQ